MCTDTECFYFRALHPLDVPIRMKAGEYLLLEIGADSVAVVIDTTGGVVLRGIWYPRDETGRSGLPALVECLVDTRTVEQLPPPPPTASVGRKRGHRGKEVNSSIRATSPPFVPFVPRATCLGNGGTTGTNGRRRGKRTP